jgi:hypothetical protein
MEYLTQLVPQNTSIAFLLLIPIPVFLISSLAAKGAKPLGKSGVVYWSVLSFYILYFTYVSFLGFNNYFEEVSLPPSILKWTMFPLLIFLLGVIFNTPIYRSILSHIKLNQLVQIHVFRLIGLFFILLFAHGALPPVFALIAGFGDLITAMSSIWVAKALRSQKAYARKLCWIWNSFGLLDILVTSFTAFFLTKLSIETGAQGVEGLAEFPFYFIPAFAPATIIFLHFSVYRKLLSKK